MRIGDNEAPGYDKKDNLFLPPIEVATVWTSCAGSPGLSCTEQEEEDQMEPALTAGHVLGEDLSSGIWISTMWMKTLPSAPQEDIISLLSSCPLYKHAWKGSPEQKSSQCLTWKMSKTVRDKSPPDRIYPEKAERAQDLHLE